jgi:hypothetical protein
MKALKKFNPPNLVSGYSPVKQELLAYGVSLLATST